MTEKYENELKELEATLLKLVFGDKITVKKDRNDIPEDSINIIKEGIELYIPLEGLINAEEEKYRIEKERARLEAEVARCEKMLSNPGFINKAPKAKIDEEKAKLAKYKDMLNRI